jgi:hypothetical protein
MLTRLTTNRFLTLLRYGVGLGFLASSFGLHAQSQVDDLDWKESDAPTPPAFKTSALVAIDMPHYVTLKFGIDPSTLQITPDGILRYVMVAVNTSGSVNAMYEGLRCTTGEAKTYARAGISGEWTVVKEPQWRSINDNLPSKHALAFARQGACEGRAMSASSVADVLKALKK